MRIILVVPPPTRFVSRPGINIPSPLPLCLSHPSILLSKGISVNQKMYIYIYIYATAARVYASLHGYACFPRGRINQGRDLYLLVVLINQFAIRCTSVDNSTVVAAFNSGAVEILLGRLCVWSEAEVILSFEGGGRCSCIDISTSARVMRWKARNEEI